MGGVRRMLLPSINMYSNSKSSLQAEIDGIGLWISCRYVPNRPPFGCTAGHTAIDVFVRAIRFSHSSTDVSKLGEHPSIEVYSRNSCGRYQSSFSAYTLDQRWCLPGAVDIKAKFPLEAQGITSGWFTLIEHFTLDEGCVYHLA